MEWELKSKKLGGPGGTKGRFPAKAKAVYISDGATAGFSGV